MQIILKINDILLEAEALNSLMEDGNNEVTREARFFTVDKTDKVQIDLEIYSHQRKSKFNPSGKTQRL